MCDAFGGIFLLETEQRLFIPSTSFCSLYEVCNIFVSDAAVTFVSYESGSIPVSHLNLSNERRHDQVFLLNVSAVCKHMNWVQIATFL